MQELVGSDNRFFKKRHNVGENVQIPYDVNTKLRIVMSFIELHVIYN